MTNIETFEIEISKLKAWYPDFDNLTPSTDTRIKTMKNSNTQPLLGLE